MPDTANPQVLDSVAQVNVKTVGESPWEALAVALQAFAHSTSLSMENAMQTQGGMQQIGNSATSAVCTMILEVAK
ncbi:MAG TPA: RebB family R body protein [Rhodocyclaceae bacterium]